jgi:hypothetical protein
MESDMHSTVMSNDSLVETCKAKALALGFKKGHHRSLDPYQSSRIECFPRSVFCFVVHGRLDIHTPKSIFCVSQGEEIVLPEKQLFQISAGDQGAQIYVAVKSKKIT